MRANAQRNSNQGETKAGKGKGHLLVQTDQHRHDRFRGRRARLLLGVEEVLPGGPARRDAGQAAFLPRQFGPELLEGHVADGNGQGLVGLGEGDRGQRDIASNPRQPAVCFARHAGHPRQNQGDLPGVGVNYDCARGRLGPADQRAARVIFEHLDVVQIGAIVVDVAGENLVFAERNDLVV